MKFQVVKPDPIHKGGETVDSEVRRNSVFFNLSIALLLLCPKFTFAAPSEDHCDDVKDYLEAASQKAKSWKADSQFLWVASGSNVLLSDGSNLCSPEQSYSGWNFIFYSQSAGAYYTAHGCQGEVSGEPSGKGFPEPPAPINQDFIGTERVIEVLRRVAKEWHLARCSSVQDLRIAGGEPKVDASFPKGRPIWATILYCKEDEGGFVFIDAISGKVLKSQRSFMK
jgi:hypothetical protein